MTSYSDEEVKEATAFFTKGNIMNGSIINPLIWASYQYLKAKPVLEWYADRMNYEMPLLTLSAEPLINDDQGQRAREFLNGQ